MLMKPLKIGTRGLLFKFDKTNSPFETPTYSFVIIGVHRIYLCDTHCGNFSMSPLKKYLNHTNPRKEIIVFNSHYHWDHVWGNCSFKNEKIISHRLCFEKLSNDFIWNYMKQNNEKYKNGEINRVLPNEIFDEKLFFPDDDVLFLYSPGHSPDSSSCFDKRDKILFVADNIEEPLPMIDCSDLDIYINTLHHYKTLQPKILVTSHNGVVGMESIDSSIKYLTDLRDKKELLFEVSMMNEIHFLNQKHLMFNRYLESFKQIDLNTFADLHQILNSHNNSNLDELEKKLKSYKLISNNVQDPLFF